MRCKKDMGKLFGTDGIRGIVGENLTAELAFRVGVLAHFIGGAVFIIGALWCP